MCSDAANGEYEGFKVKNESGAEATTSENRLHLNDILEMLIRLDQQGIFMNPVDDSIAPDYCKVIKKPMCFLKMREKINGGQYTSWISFVEDFECICYNAMKYNRKRSKIWNAANLMLRHGKRCLEQQSSNHIILGVSKAHNGINFQDDSAAKVIGDQTCQGTQLDNLLGNPDDCTNVISTECLVSNFSVGQGPNSTEKILAVSEMVVGEQMTAPSSEPPSKSLNENLSVDILTFLPKEDIRLHSEVQATECSSSFSAIQGELEGESCETESEFRDGNGAIVPTENITVTSRRRKRALDPDWKTYRQGIEWRCRWLELRVEALQAESNKYKRTLETAKTHKDQYQQDGLVARTSTMDGYIHKNLVLRRRRRKKVEENVEFNLYMSRHPVFSRYGEKKQHNQELSSTEEGARDEKQHILEFDDFDLDFEDEYEDNIVVENESMEHNLWQIEALQMQILKLKNQLIRQTAVPENTAEVQLKNAPPSQLSVSGSSQNMSALTPQLHRHSSSGLGPRSTIRGSKGHGGTPSSRRRNSDFDINNVVMPDTVMANYVEPPRHDFIETPHWRWLEGVSALEEEGTSEEDTDDDVYKTRHAQMQLKEREQQYTPLPLNKGRTISMAKERPKSDIARRMFTTNATSGELLDDELPFGYIPRRKRRKRESRDTAAITKGS